MVRRRRRLDTPSCSSMNRTMPSRFWKYWRPSLPTWMIEPRQAPEWLSSSSGSCQTRTIKACVSSCTAYSFASGQAGFATACYTGVVFQAFTERGDAVFGEGLWSLWAGHSLPGVGEQGRQLHVTSVHEDFADEALDVSQFRARFLGHGLEMLQTFQDSLRKRLE